ncbi:DUF5060 domain-containing protein [Vibrio sp. F13]|uniref:DUF5060 domain-containing protein n=1 Tax=Vibrio sp. F13 TaxID=2070777 RepID=UPI0010BD8102|nr:DUF5060 domain-containing protein [Vibrio sp. F13]TKF54671.1 DUF5060 domain-containing protein [Vibrio sp. F13]
MKKFTLPLLLMSGLTINVAAQEIRIIDQADSPAAIPKYNKFSHSFIINGVDFTNPFDSSEVQVDAFVVAPDGSELTVPMFYKSSTAGNTQWGFNFAPRKAGSYSYHIEMQHDGQNIKTNSYTFKSLPSDSKGFLGVDNNMGSWVYDNGDRFRGVGLNIGWEARLEIDDKPADDPGYTYEYWMKKMNESDVNLIRTWINAPWNIPLEWNQPVYGRFLPNQTPGLHPEAIDRFDYLIDHAEKNDVKLILVMDYHGSLWANDFDNWGNDYWRLNPYNEVNGGPASTPEEFFTHPEAISRYQDRLRYIVARWGYSTNIAAIEFWNEVDNAVHKKDQNISDEAVTNWHSIMSNYLNSVDPYNHIQTTSISHIEIDGLFELKGIDFIQTHLYGLSSTDTEKQIRDMSERYTKSYAVGEAALGWEGVQDRIEEYALHLHESLWVAMFNKTPFLPMTWWWEDYDEAEQMYHLKHAANFIENLTSTDEVFDQKLAVSLDEDLLYRTLSNGDTHFFWVKNTTDSKLNSTQITLFGDDDTQLSGKFSVELYDTWTGETKVADHLNAVDNKVVFSLSALDKNKDLVVMFTSLD